MAFESVGEVVKMKSSSPDGPQRKAGGGGKFETVAEAVAIKTNPAPMVSRTATGGAFESVGEMSVLNKTPQRGTTRG